MGQTLDHRREREKIRNKDKEVLMPCYFFSGQKYIRVHRGETGPGTVDQPGYPADLVSGWSFDKFKFAVPNGIDATMYDDTGSYFFAGTMFIRLTRGEEGPGTLDGGYPKKISDLGWPSEFCSDLDAALYSEGKAYFFKGQNYIRVSRSPGVLSKPDPNYPASIGAWQFDPTGGTLFASSGISAALNSGSVDYFFEKYIPHALNPPRYIRMPRGETGPGKIDSGYPAPITDWGWSKFGFGDQGIRGALFSGKDS
jgi:hypothetical protein